MSRASKKDTLEHISMDSGHVRSFSPRHEVSAAAIEAARGMLAGEVVAHWRIDRVLYFPRGAGAAFRLIWRSIPMVSCTLCDSEAHSAMVWSRIKTAHEQSGVTINAVAPTSTPWLGVVLLDGHERASLPVHAEAGDLERVIAWTMLDDSRSGGAVH